VGRTQKSQPLYVQKVGVRGRGRRKPKSDSAAVGVADEDRSVKTYGLDKAGDEVSK
jgi:hypothetical protein